MSVLTDSLENLLGKETVIVMNDGMAFKGMLTKFDKDAVILQHVLESKADDTMWKESIVASKITRSDNVEGIAIGDTDVVKLDEVVIRMEMISRIWAWAPHKPGRH